MLPTASFPGRLSHLSACENVGVDVIQLCILHRDGDSKASFESDHRTPIQYDAASIYLGFSQDEVEMFVSPPSFSFTTACNLPSVVAEPESGISFDCLLSTYDKSIIRTAQSTVDQTAASEIIVESSLSHSFIAVQKEITAPSTFLR